MKVGSLFAGIGGFDLGFERAGFEVAWCVEWDKNAQAVLRKRFPNAQVYGDIREVDPDKLERVDVICGGFPCQDLSVAGKRAGLAGERSGLFHDAMRIVRQLRPSVLILENVPGLLSSNRGLDFATVLREVGEGWDCAEVGWRVLDSQYFGVAQRRRRVFVVAGSRVGCAEQILALAEGGGGDPPSRDEAREGASSDAAGGTGFGRWWDGSDCAATLTKQNANGSQRMPDKGNFGAVVQPFTGSSHAQYRQGIGTLRASGGDLGGGSENIVVQPTAIQGNLIGRDQGGPHGVGAREDGTMYTLTKTDIHAVAFGISNQPTPKIAKDICPSLDAKAGGGGRVEAVAFRKSKRAQSADDDETWVDDGLANTLNGFDTGDTRTTHAVAFTQNQRDEVRDLGDLAASLSGQGTHQTNYVAFTIDMQACKGNANIGDGSVSPTLCKPSGNDCHAIVFHPTQDPISSTGATHALGCESKQGCATVGVCVTGDRTHSLTSNGADASEDGIGRGTPISIAFHQNQMGDIQTSNCGFTLGTTANATARNTPLAQVGMVVRRLTPVECERLQGFPDGWTQIGTDKPTADTHRYKQLGNAVTVNVAEWIARRTMAWLVSH